MMGSRMNIRVSFTFLVYFYPLLGWRSLFFSHPFFFSFLLFSSHVLFFLLFFLFLFIIQLLSPSQDTVYHDKMYLIVTKWVNGE